MVPEFADVAVTGLATFVLEAGVTAGGVTVSSILAPVIVVSFLGYKFSKSLLARCKEKKLKQKERDNGSVKNNCCNGCAQGNSCGQTARKVGCTPEELAKRRREAEKLAEKLKFNRTRNFPFDAHGEAVFKKGREYITIDNTCHTGGFWKKFVGEHRDGTYSRDLKIKVGD